MCNLIKMKIRFIYLILIAVLLVSCAEGYEKTNGKWTWVIHSESGKHIREINADNTTFQILNHKKYAKDKSYVYFEGEKIDNADPKTFEVIAENGYSKDNNSVYLDNDIIIFANPKTFKAIEWPYSKDDKRIYNGNLPMEVDNIREFNITKTGKGKNSSIKSFFIEWNKNYKWLDTLSVKVIIVGEDAEAKTKTAKYKGFKKVE